MSKTILLVDDDTYILETAKDILEAADYAVLTAETGAVAQQTLKENACDLMIVDFHLLDIAGPALAMKVKPLYPKLVIVLMTGEAQVDLGDAKPLISAVLTKPVNPPDLFELIRRYI